MKDRRPDLVLSGVNRGANLGEDVTYSGTVAGGMEATLLGIPSIALQPGIATATAATGRRPRAFGAEVVRALVKSRWPHNG